MGLWQQHIASTSGLTSYPCTRVQRLSANPRARLQNNRPNVAYRLPMGIGRNICNYDIPIPFICLFASSAFALKRRYRTYVVAAHVVREAARVVNDGGAKVEGAGGPPAPA